MGIGQMHEVRFDSLNLHDAGTNDVGRGEIGSFDALGRDVGLCACSEASDHGSKTERGLSGSYHPEEWVQRTLLK